MTRMMADGGETGSTRDKIMLEAAILFAENGYAAVSVRDIAERVQIRSSSIYNHFESKEALFNAIVDRIGAIYMAFYDRVEEKLRQVSSFRAVLACLFAELLDVYDIFVYYGVSLICAEQFRNKKARDTYNHTIMQVGVAYAKDTFDICIKKGWVKAFDTLALAQLFMNSVLMGTLARTHESMQQEAPYKAAEMFLGLQRYILSSVEIL